MKLVIGNKNYSTWSLRPWLLLTAFEIDFKEVLVSLKAEGLTQRLAKHSDAAKVPVLVDDDITIWDTIAICEYISETHLNGKGWPNDKKQRAIARSLTAEMHGGFSHIRGELPMNIRAKRKVQFSAELIAQVTYIDGLWCQYIEQYGGDNGYLFDQYSIVDCFFTPVASRFKTYDVVLSPRAQQYCDQLLNHSAMQKWQNDSELDKEFLPADEAGTDV